MICSMTAFARFEKKYSWGNISWEIRSLNQRYLDIYIDIPKYLHGLSWSIRKKIKDFLMRGRIECYLHIEMSNTITNVFNVNEQLVRHLIISAEWVKKQTKEGEIDPFSILSWPGVITSCKQYDIANIHLILLKCFEETLKYLIEDRVREGLFLKKQIIQKLWSMHAEVEKLRRYIPDVLNLKRRKLIEQMKDLCIDIDKIKLEQELLIITQKIDISEEIDRLISHIKEAYNVLLRSGPVGRRLDFISQELYREANTVSAKSINFGITQSAISLKVLIEQIREQVQNIE